jgi:hypothetical protein
MDKALQRVKWISGGLWLGSWYLMWLEVFRWKHVTRSLSFNAGPPIPGTNIHIKPGRPLKALFACFYAAPSIFVLAVTAGRIRKPGRGEPQMRSRHWDRQSDP